MDPDQEKPRVIRLKAHGDDLYPVTEAAIRVEAELDDVAED